MTVTSELQPVDLVSLSLMRRSTQDGTARVVRERAGVSQDELARTCGTTAASISRWETGERRPVGRTAERYASALFALALSLDDGADPRIAELRAALLRLRVGDG